MACRACEEFYPVKRDGKRLHAALHTDPNGGVWAQSCRVGPCDFRDPQTQPVGGVVGIGDDRTCITLDPVPWFTDCDQVLNDDASSMLDVTRYCSYREQIF